MVFVVLFEACARKNRRRHVSRARWSATSRRALCVAASTNFRYAPSMRSRYICSTEAMFWGVLAVLVGGAPEPGVVRTGSASARGSFTIPSTMISSRRVAKRTAETGTAIRHRIIYALTLPPNAALLQDEGPLGTPSKPRLRGSVTLPRPVLQHAGRNGSLPQARRQAPSALQQAYTLASRTSIATAALASLAPRRVPDCSARRAVAHVPEELIGAAERVLGLVASQPVVRYVRQLCPRSTLPSSRSSAP